MAIVRYVFRADGNSKIGAGHIMRCLTIATALSEKVSRENIVFLCAGESSCDVVRGKGFKAYSLESDYTDMVSEFAAWEEYDISKAIILVDSYYADNTYLAGLKRYGTVGIIDDMQKYTYDVDFIINYNVFANPKLYRERYGISCRCYLGGKYAPIRSEFSEAKWKLRDEVTDILISTGGGDNDNMGGKIYKAVSKYKPDITYHLISGVFNPYYNQLKEWESENSNLIVYHDVHNMAELMEKCDLAITAGGSTIYEMSVVGIPFLCFSFAENQEGLVKYIGNNISDYAGAYNENKEETLNNISELVINKYLDASYRRRCSSKAREMIDGMGADRIAEILAETLYS